MGTGIRILAFVLLSLGQSIPGYCASDYVQVEIDKGTLRGLKTTTWQGFEYSSFKGIPYAKPPIEELRFKAPQEEESWDEVRDALEHGSVCPQHSLITGKMDGEEDCLFLNVYTPSVEADALPVMAFIHGGLFIEGSGNDGEYAPDYFVKNGVILVTLNYRVGALGFLSTQNDDAPGNAGMKDQVAALRWVKRNIAKFGGDPDNVTIFGESAGGCAVHYHLLSPMSAGLFKRAIGQSGSSLNGWALAENPAQYAIRLAKALGAAENVDATAALEFLKTAPAQNIVAKQGITLASAEEVNLLVKFFFVPTVERNITCEEVFLPNSPLNLLVSGNFSQVPYMTGYTTHEGYLGLFDPIGLNIDNASIDNLDRYIPKNIENVELREDVAKSLRKLYFNDIEIVSKSDPNLIDLLTDSLFAAGIHVATSFQLRFNHTPIYFYEFSYDGGLNKAKKFLNIPLPGASHSDELGYLFYAKLLSTLKPVSGSEDEYVLNTMVRLWTNFAKYGNPSPDGEVLTWKPVTINEFNFLNLSGRDTKSHVIRDYNGPDRSNRINTWLDAYVAEVVLRD